MTPSEDVRFLECGNVACGKTSCVHCAAEVTAETGGVDAHALCSIRMPVVQKVLSALDEATVACPGCGTRGVKDGACTHMYCPSCYEKWCYFCGKLCMYCDGSYGSSDDFNDHNTDWEWNEARCPWFLEHISEHGPLSRANPEWPSDPEDCVEYMSQQRVLRALRAVVDEITYVYPCCPFLLLPSGD